MGHIFAKVLFENPDNGHSASETALVDTGATDTVIPERIAKQLRLRILGSIRVETGKGTVRLNESTCRIKIRNRSKILPVLVSRHIRRVLIGVTTLESMALQLDPVKGRLIPGRILLYLSVARPLKARK